MQSESLCRLRDEGGKISSIVLSKMTYCQVQFYLYKQCQILCRHHCQSIQLFSVMGSTQILSLCLNLCPVLFSWHQGCFVFSLAKYTPLTYNKVYIYPDWAIGLGWGLALSSMICIPLLMVIRIMQSDGSLIEVRSRKSLKISIHGNGCFLCN